MALTGFRTREANRKDSDVSDQGIGRLWPWKGPREPETTVWAGGDNQAGLQRMKRVDRVPSQQALLVLQTHVSTCPTWISPPGPSVVLPLSPSTLHPIAPHLGVCLPSLWPLSQHRPFHQPPGLYPIQDLPVPTTALSQPIVCPSGALVQSHLSNNQSPSIGPPGLPPPF